MLGEQGPGSTGSMLNIETGKAASVAVTLRRLANRFKPCWSTILLVILLVVAGTWTQVTAPLLIGQSVDCYLAPQFLPDNHDILQTDCPFPIDAPSGAKDIFLQGLGKMVLSITALYVAGALINGLQFYLIGRVGQQMLKTLRVDIFTHLQRLTMNFYHQNEAGSIMSRITNDIDTLQQSITFALVDITGGVLLIAWILYNMFSRNAYYALICIAVIPLMTIATLWISQRARNAFRRTRQRIGRLNANLQESIAGVRQAQAFNREQANIDAFQADNAANRDANIEAITYTSLLAPTLEALNYLGIAITCVSGGFMLLDGAPFNTGGLSLGLMITFLAYTQRFNQPIQQIAMMWANLQSAVAGAERIFALLDTSPDFCQPVEATVMPPIAGWVEFRNVSAAYHPRQKVLKGISFKVNPGQTVAIVGPTGAGKTTLTNLIPRFYQVSAGTILIDGIDISRVTLESLRRQIGIALQDTTLFSDSVLNNIRFGKAHANEEEVQTAARLAHADDFIRRLPQGYQTLLGENGVGLSQGQRQLLSIARAVLTDPRILILDEATSSVDTRTEISIQAAMQEIMKDRTTFIIAHRLNTIHHADMILVIDNGIICERGCHQELMKKQGIYYHLYMQQYDQKQGNPLPAVSG